jgi:RHH-type proline utilization regulon transcriptional repressor/proline dehydrogenase/delta 1-pyrroline-5-carboxylate dehydrogenase
VRLLHRAGVPPPVLQFVPGPGATLGGRLAADERVNGVVFTGSTATAQSINRQLAARRGAIVPLIAETGGQNAMIVDSSALLEQVVVDVLQSAFNSAGQRCSALRVLFVQDEIAERLLKLLAGAMQELVIGDPMHLATDVGPVIDAAAKMRQTAKPLCELPLPADADKGTFVAPCVFEIPRLDLLEGEVFGPVLHVIRYQATALDQVIDAINGSGYGLTLGIASRIDSTIRHIQSHARVGNIYVNRNMIGAVVGVQPFGGEGLSGTGPKAGGPNYLLRFATERTVSVNTAAIGGNTGLSALD